MSVSPTIIIERIESGITHPALAEESLNQASVQAYRRDWLIGACAYRLRQQENMRLLYVCAY